MINQERIKIQNDVPQECNICGDKVYIGYDEGGRFICSHCAHAFGAIDTWQLMEDIYEEGECIVNNRKE